MNDLAKSLSAFAALGKQKMEQVVRLTMLDVLGQCVERSPVGNPDLWEANSKVMAARTAYADAAVAYNEANPGKRRKGTSKATLNKKFKLKAGGAYTGGRFKNNWQVGLGAINSAQVDQPDSSGSSSMSRAQTALGDLKLGQVIFVSNNLPYAWKLEFAGHSKQAPNGMARLALQNTSQAIAKAARSVRGR